MGRPADGYRDRDGTLVPSVTEIIKAVWPQDTDRLLDWAARLARQGIDWRQERALRGAAGTYAHQLLELSLTGGAPVGPPPELDYHPDLAAAAVVAAASAVGWLIDQRARIVSVEVPLVGASYTETGDTLVYGGTHDVIVEIAGALTVVDLKTGSLAGQPCWWPQLQAYAELYDQVTSGPHIDGSVVLHCPIKKGGQLERAYYDLHDGDLIHWAAVVDAYCASHSISALPQKEEK